MQIARKLLMINKRAQWTFLELNTPENRSAFSCRGALLMEVATAPAKRAANVRICPKHGVINILNMLLKPIQKINEPERADNCYNRRDNLLSDFLRLSADQMQLCN